MRPNVCMSACLAGWLSVRRKQGCLAARSVSPVPLLTHSPILSGFCPTAGLSVCVSAVKCMINGHAEM